MKNAANKFPERIFVPTKDEKEAKELQAKLPKGMVIAKSMSGLLSDSNLKYEENQAILSKLIALGIDFDLQ